MNKDLYISDTARNATGYIMDIVSRETELTAENELVLLDAVDILVELIVDDDDNEYFTQATDGNY